MWTFHSVFCGWKERELYLKIPEKWKRCNITFASVGCKEFAKWDMSSERHCSLSRPSGRWRAASDKHRNVKTASSGHSCFFKSPPPLRNIILPILPGGCATHTLQWKMKSNVVWSFFSGRNRKKSRPRVSKLNWCRRHIKSSKKGIQVFKKERRIQSPQSLLITAKNINGSAECEWLRSLCAQKLTKSKIIFSWNWLFSSSAFLFMAGFEKRLGLDDRISSIFLALVISSSSRYQRYGFFFELL